MGDTPFAGHLYQHVILSNPTTHDPFTVASSGVVSVASGDAILGTAGHVWTVSKYGAVSASGSASGVKLTAGGTMTNEGVIAANRGIEVYLLSTGLVMNGRSGSTVGCIGSDRFGEYAAVRSGRKASFRTSFSSLLDGCQGKLVGCQPPERCVRTALVVMPTPRFGFGLRVGQ